MIQRSLRFRRNVAEYCFHALKFGFCFSHLLLSGCLRDLVLCTNLVTHLLVFSLFHLLCSRDKFCVNHGMGHVFAVTV